MVFERYGVRYEVACDVLGALIADLSYALAVENEKPVQNVRELESIEAQKRALRILRDNLDTKDKARIEDVIKRYGPLAREAYR